MVIDEDDYEHGDPIGMVAEYGSGYPNVIDADHVHNLENDQYFGDSIEIASKVNYFY